MTDPSLTYSQQTSTATRNATSLRGSGGGPLRSPLPDGQDHAHVPHSAARAKNKHALNASKTEKKVAVLSRALDELVSSCVEIAATHGMQIAGTYGRSSGDSSPSVDLQQSLENRFRAKMDVSGSLEYELRWKFWDMVLGPPICALRASVRRTSGNDCGGWPTPVRADDGHKVTRASKQPGLVAMPDLVGPDPQQSPVSTENRAALVLNPAMSRWLMGYPAAWDTLSPGWKHWASMQKLLDETARADCQDTETPSSRK